MDTDKMIAMIEKAHTIAAQKRIPFQPTEHGYSNYQDGCLAMKLALLAMLSETESAEDQEIFPGTLAALERLTPNVDVTGPRLRGSGGQQGSTAWLAVTDVIYSYKHDAYYSATTGKWLEKQCGSPDCEFCKDRPATANV